MVIAGDEQLREACEAFRTEPFCAVDTEFLWERTYLPQVSLVQLGSPAHVVVIDVLSVNDLTPLGELLQRPDQPKIIHAASQDIPILRDLTGTDIAPFFDSQIGAAMAGMRYQISLADLVQEFLGVAIDKSTQRTNWLERPLSDKQLQYAADDVRLLAALYPLLLARLEELGRRTWAEADSARLLSDSQGVAIAPAEAHLQIKGGGRLSPRGQLLFQRLAAWREQEAMAADLRPRLLMPDATIADIAKHGSLPGPAELRHMRHAVRRRFERLLPSIEELVEATAAVPEEALPTPPRHRRPSAAEKALLEKGVTLAGETAKRLGIPASVLATRADISELVRDPYESGKEPASVLLSTWRRDVFGQALLDLVMGTRPEPEPTLF